MLIVLTIPSLILFFILYFTYKSIATYKNGMLFAVTLPPNALDHPHIQQIQKDYLKSFNLALLVQIIAYLPLIFIMKWASIGLIYYFLWIISAITIVVIPYRKAFRATLELKRQQDWFVGKKQMIHADLRAAQLKNKRTAAPQLFLIPLALSILLTWWAGSQDTALYSIGAAAIFTTVLFGGIVMLLRRSRSTVYSENSEINLALNQHKRRLLTYLFFWLSIFEIIHIMLLTLVLLADNEGFRDAWLYTVIGYSIIPLSIIMLVYQRIGSMRRELLTLDSNPVYSDDDEYWSNGFTYHNPFDRSLLVPKRVGIGETINTGTLAGKIIIGGLIGLLLAVMIGVSFMLVRSELTSPSLTIKETAEIEIHYPMYSYSFSAQDIEELALVNDIPSGIRSNGEATDKFARGHFKLKELGKSRLYIFKNNPPYIQIRLADQYIFYNDLDPAVTKQLYEQLQTLLKQTP